MAKLILRFEQMPYHTSVIYGIEHILALASEAFDYDGYKFFMDATKKNFIGILGKDHFLVMATDGSKLNPNEFVVHRSLFINDPMSANSLELARALMDGKNPFDVVVEKVKKQIAELCDLLDPENFEDSWTRVLVSSKPSMKVEW